MLADAGCSARTAIVRGIEDYPPATPASTTWSPPTTWPGCWSPSPTGGSPGRTRRPSASAILQAQAYRDGIPAGLPADVVVGNKTGWIDAVNHDVALVRAPDLPPIGLAVLCSAPGTPEEREAGIARIAAAAWAAGGERPGVSPSTMSR